MLAQILPVFWLLILSLWLATAAAETVTNYDAIFEQALDSVDFEFDQNWAYTETHVDKEHVWVGRFDPRRESRARWRLLTIDDREPSDSEIEKYRKIKANEQSDAGERQVSAMVEPGSIRLVEETDEYWLLGFVPGDDEDIMGSVDATMRISKAKQHLEYIELRNHAIIKPGPGVKISKLITRLTFGPAADGGPVVPLSSQVEVTGRAFLFIAIDEQELSRNNEFEYVGDDREMGPDG